MDVLRTTCSVMGSLEPEAPSLSPATTTAAAERLMGVFTSALLYWFHFAATGKRLVPNTTPTDTLAAAFVKARRRRSAPLLGCLRHYRSDDFSSVQCSAVH